MKILARKKEEEDGGRIWILMSLKKKMKIINGHNLLITNMNDKKINRIS